MAPTPLIVACETPRRQTLFEWYLPSLNEDNFASSMPEADTMMETFFDYMKKKSGQRNELSQKLNKVPTVKALMPRRVDKNDSVEWHLRVDAWMRPKDVEMSLDVPNRRLELSVRREESGTTACAKHTDQEKGAEKHKTAEKDNEHKENVCSDCSTFSSVRQIRRSFTLTEDIDLDKLQATLSSDRSEFVVSAPLKRKREADQSQNAPLPIKIIRK